MRQTVLVHLHALKVVYSDPERASITSAAASAPAQRPVEIALDVNLEKARRPAFPSATA
jgi:hypothetical protein